jgi:hypothetical protein
VSGAPPDLPDWSLLREWLETAGERPQEWRTAGLWALNMLERELGTRWPERTWIKFDRLPGVVVMASSQVFAFAELIELALRLNLLKEAVGYDRLTKRLKRNIAPSELAHLRVQLEVAGLAKRAGWLVTFEPEISSSNRSADLLLRRDDEELLIECAAMVRSDAAVAADQWMQTVTDRLRPLNGNLSVGVVASFSEHLSDEETTSFLATVNAAALFVSRGGVMPPLRARGATVELQADGGVYSITGPSESIDHAAKLRSLLAEKAEQTHGKTPAWICVHSLAGLFWGTDWARRPIEAKLQALSDIVTEALASHPHVVGAAISNGAALVDMRTGRDEATLDTGSMAVQQPVPPIKHREVYVVPTLTDAPGLSFLTSAYRDERSWLDWALARQDLPSVDAIFAGYSPEA